MIEKDVFLKPVLPEREVDLPGLGTVRVRALSRSEAVGLAVHKNDVRKLECQIIRCGLVDPVLTDAEMVGWYAEAPSGLVDLLIAAIDSLSGMSDGAPKSGVPGVREGS